jgi:hypothetical protein
VSLCPWGHLEKNRSSRSFPTSTRSCFLPPPPAVHVCRGNFVISSSHYFDVQILKMHLAHCTMYLPDTSIRVGLCLASCAATKAESTTLHATLPNTSLFYRGSRDLLPIHWLLARVSNDHEFGTEGVYSCWLRWCLVRQITQMNSTKIMYWVKSCEKMHWGAWWGEKT